MDDKGLFQDLAHGHAGVKRGIGVLEDDLDLAPQLLQTVAGDLGQVFPGEDDAAPGGRQQGHHQAAQGGLAAAGLPHQPQGLPGSQGKTHPVHRLEHRPPAPGAGQAEVAA